MAALGRPVLPAGPVRVLFGELHDLHHRAGWPSLRDIARQVGCSRTTVSRVFSGPMLPRWGLLELIVETLGGQVEHFHRLWLAASGVEDSRPAGEEPAPAAASAPFPPRQLPADVAGFTGRAEHLAALDELLVHGGGSGAVVICAVAGTAGVGKTALAVHWAHRVADRFPDGQLYVNLRGFDPGKEAMAPDEAVRGFLDAFAVPAQRIPPSLDAQAALYRSVLAGKRVLVVLDNVRDAEQARVLLPGSHTALVLVTSRKQLTPLVASGSAHPLALDLLTPAEARELLARRLGPDRLAAEQQAVEEIIVRCARLPLALTIAAARAAVHPDFPLAAIARELAAAGGPLDALDAGDPTTQVRAVFSWSYTALDPPAARLFRLLGLHPGRDISAATAASLVGQPLSQVRPLLAELVRASLLCEHRPGRYSWHDLLRAYAIDLTSGDDSADARAAATTRLLDHYLHTACAADRLLDPHRDPPTLSLAAPAPGTQPEHLADPAHAKTWLTLERNVLLAATRHSADNGFDTRTWQLAWALDTYLDRQGLWHDLATVWRTALDAAERLGEVSAQAYAHRLLGQTHIRLGRYGDADQHLRRALELYTNARDRAGQAHTHLDLSWIRERQNQPDQALVHDQRALDLFRAVRHQRGQANALNGVGWDYSQLGDYGRALTYCEHALALHQELGNRWGEADTWDSLGYAHRHLCHYSDAVNCYQRAVDLYRDLGDRYQEAAILTNLGDTHHAAANPTVASTTWRHALDILTDLNHPDADDIRAKLHNLDDRAHVGR